MADADSLMDLDEEDNPVGYGVGEDALLPPTAEGVDDLDSGRAAQQLFDASTAGVGDTVAPTLDQPVAPTLAPETPETAPEVAPAAAPAPGSAADILSRSNEAAGLATRQGKEDVERAKIQAATAAQQATDARLAEQEANLERAEYLQRRKDLERDLDAKVKAYESQKLTDPRQRTNGLKATLAVIFGGLGAAFRSAGGGDSHNTGLQALQKKWEDDTELQKANIAALRDQAVQARTRLADADDGRRNMMRDADARLVAKYNSALRQGEAQLKDRGVAQAQIDADQRIVSLRTARDQALARARQADDAHALNQAKIERLKAQASGTGPSGATEDVMRARARLANAQADRLERRAKGGGGGGGAAGADVAQYLINNPGDIPGAKRLAAQKGVGSKEFDKIVGQTKPTESQAKDAKQASVGLRAVDAIERSGYTPSRDDVQKWLNNQRLTYAAGAPGVKGLVFTLGQNIGAVPQSEVEGLSDNAKSYFGSVRRYMETIGRAQSGAAISPTEWENFFNQYGPNSKGGLEAARQYLRDQFNISGVAGRQISATGGTPSGARQAVPEPSPDELARMRKAKARGIHDFDEIIERYRGK